MNDPETIPDTPPENINRRNFVERAGVAALELAMIAVATAGAIVVAKATHEQDQTVSQKPQVPTPK